MPEKNKIKLPKTFTTKKGPLLLFSEEKPKNLANKSLNEFTLHRTSKKYAHHKNEFMSSTINDFRKYVLDFDQNSDKYGMYSKSMKLERDNSIVQLNRESKLMGYELFDKIRPGFSAKRYLSNWARHWDPDLVDNLSKKGYLKEESLFEKPQVSEQANYKHRLNDDLSRIPPAYRLQQQWFNMNVSSLNGYRFYRVQNNLFNLGNYNVN